MGLWIATQDDKSLVNAKEITVDGKKIEGVIVSSTMNHWGKVLGKYETKERAKEILKEIFKVIEESSGKFVTYTMPKK